MARSLTGVIFSLFFLAGMAAAQQQASPAPAGASGQAQFVGSTVCRGCHPTVAAPFFKNPHFKSVAAGNQPPELTGCEGCHGPGGAHVAAKGGKTTIPRAFSLMKPEAVIETCLTCHAKDLNRANIMRSQHTLNQVACTSCHSIHHSTTPKALLAKTQHEVCYGCHTNVRAQFSMPFKHRVNEGFMECTDCHNPHGTNGPTWRMGARPRMVTQEKSVEEPCLKCHVDKRGPFMFEHAATRIDGCETCHSPHGSPNPRMLKRPVVFTVCLECHTGAGNFGRSGQGIPQQAFFHDMTTPRFQNCTTCHVRIHGSNADPHFFK